MPRLHQFPTSQTALTDASGVPKTHNLTTLFLAALAASGVSRPAGGSYCAAYAVISNVGTGDAYLATSADIPAAADSIEITTEADGVWEVEFLSPDGVTTITAQYTAAGSATKAAIAAGLRAALVIAAAAVDVTIGGATVFITITSDNVLAPHSLVVVTEAGLGASTVTDTGSETAPRTNEVIGAESGPENPYTFGPYFIDDLPYLRCLADAECSVTFKMEVP